VDRQKKEKFFREVEIVRNLDHPNILKVFEFYQDAKNYYLVTEYCKGGELFDKIVEKGTFLEEEAAHILKQALSCVMYCHTHNIVHRYINSEILHLLEI
jgi:calcium-dependent protein kinase